MNFNSPRLIPASTLFKYPFRTSGYRGLEFLTVDTEDVYSYT